MMRPLLYLSTERKAAIDFVNSVNDPGIKYNHANIIETKIVTKSTGKILLILFS